MRHGKTIGTRTAPKTIVTIVPQNQSYKDTIAAAINPLMPQLEPPPSPLALAAQHQTLPLPMATAALETRGVASSTAAFHPHGFFNVSVLYLNSLTRS